MLIGTFCRFSSRLVAVMMMSSPWLAAWALSEVSAAPLAGPLPGGAPGAAILVKGEAGGIELKAEGGEEPAHLTLGIVEQPLVDDAVDPAGQHAVEMRHKRDIVRIIAPHCVERIAESLTPGIMLLEV